MSLCLTLCRHRPGHSLGKFFLLEMKNEKNYVGFRIPKVWQFLNNEDFAFMGIFASENHTVTMVA